MEFVRNSLNVDINKVFSNNYLDAKGLFWAFNGTIPLMYSVYPIDIEKSIQFIETHFADKILHKFSSLEFDKNTKTKKFTTDEIYFVFKDKNVVMLRSNYCDIYSKKEDSEFVFNLSSQIRKYHRKERKREFEINLISFDGREFGLKDIEVKKTRLDLNLYYEDDFIEIDKIIVERLSKKNDKGIVLLHGLPGTGKTTYLRYLIGRLKKRVLFIPPSVAGNITNPEFMNLLLDYPNSVLIIEDAENIIMDRQITGSSAVSNLLNISDGLLGDCLKTQIICTFNMPISKIDSALMRKGRLIAKYNFGKLSIDKAKSLAKRMKLNCHIEQPMTISEIFNIEDRTFNDKPTNVVGFRSASMMN
jgi:SpoVK/Ycf46/Vps4 family AAA+-type ATPase